MSGLTSSASHAEQSVLCELKILESLTGNNLVPKKLFLPVAVCFQREHNRLDVSAAKTQLL